MGTDVAGGEFRGTDRFRVIRRLGGGGYGVVYRVYDKKRSNEVALKTLKQMTPRALYRFKKEFRALANVSHPNLVSLYELLSSEGWWFFTMELVEGPNFRDYVLGEAPPESAASDRPTAQEATYDFAHGSGSDPREVKPRRILPLKPDFDKLRDALRQLAEGLCALHDTGKLHRDIKPSNVRVTTDNRVVLLDFGLVTELAPINLMQSIDFVGSPAYMSPEQATGKPVTAASDWYNVGVMLFEALTGQLPFFGGFTEVLLAKQQNDAPNPADLLPDIPPDLGQLCVSMLQRDPTLRIAGSSLLQHLGGKAPPRRFVVSDTNSAHGSALFGREVHLSALDSAIETVRKGSPVTALVRGQSGMGKSALVNTFITRLQSAFSESVVLAGKCYQQESVPYKALDSLVDALSRYLARLSHLEAALIMPRDILSLARLFPVLRQVEVIESSNGRVPTDPKELRRRGFGALKELLARLADRRMLVLYIDDLQWGDEDSVSLLSDLLRPPDPPNLLLIVCHRDGPGHETHLLTSMFATPSHGSTELDLRDITVGALSTEEAERLAEQLLDGSEITTGQSAAELARESGGIPLFLQELVRYAREESGEAPAAAEDPEATLQSLLEIRLSRLTRGALKLLQFIAVAGKPITSKLAYTACRLSLNDQAPLKRLVSDNLIRFTRSRRDAQEIETFHDRIRETVVYQLPAQDLREIHRRLAESTEELQLAEPETLAQLFERVGNRTKTAHYMTLSAERARLQLAFHRAAELFQKALAYTDDQTTAAELTIKLAEILTALGRGVEAAGLFLSVEPTDPHLGFRLKRQAADQLLRSGHLDEGTNVVKQVLLSQGISWPDSTARTLLSLLSKRAWLRLRGTDFTERSQGSIAPELLEKVETTWSTSIGLSMADTFRGADFQTRSLLLALKAGEPYRVARALAMEAAYIASFGRPTREKSLELLRRAGTLADRIAHPHAIGLVQLVSGVAAYLVGDWASANKLCERAEKIFRDQCTGVAWEIASANIYIYAALYYTGQLGDMRLRMPLFLREAREIGDLYAAAGLRSFFYNTVLLADDEPEAARRDVLDIASRWSQHGFHVYHFFQMLSNAQISLYTRNPVSAWDHLTGRAERLRSSQLLRIQYARIENCFIQGRVALAMARIGKQQRKMLDCAGSMAAKLERERTAWSEGYSLLLEAGIAALIGHYERAVVDLSSAERRFDSRGMQLFASAARRRRGELTSGDHGRKLIQEADAWMDTQGIKRPQRYTEMLTPGFAAGTSTEHASIEVLE